MTNGSSQGLFVIVAVVIFGIFVLISYVLFRNELKPTLANIFTDGLEQAEENLTGIVKEKPINIQSSREDENYLYAKIRDANEAKNETEIWVQAKKLDDGTLELDKSSISDGNYTSGYSDMTGSLAIPDTINGKKITLIKEKAFFNARFTGSLTLPKYLQSIGRSAFEGSKFSGSLTLPDEMASIEDAAFYYSNFTGSLTLPNNLSSIKGTAFYYSNFTGTLDISNIGYIGNFAFGKSSISTVKNDSLDNNNKTIGKEAIRMSNGSYYSVK